jgi:hypothetical protein
MHSTAGDHTTGRLPGLDDKAEPPSVVMSFGLGLDSTALLMRWIVDPAARNFDLRDLAMTGHESAATREAMSTGNTRYHNARNRRRSAVRRQRAMTASCPLLALSCMAWRIL